LRITGGPPVVRVLRGKDRSSSCEQMVEIGHLGKVVSEPCDPQQ
jgi:hypothetical protein